MAAVQAIFDRSYDDRPILSPDRSLGSVIKLLTPNPAEFTPEYNAWLESIPNHVRALVFVIKRFHRPEWGDDWRRHFSVDIINGAPGHELKYEGRRLVASYLRIGREENGAWRTYKLRQDFVAADKVQMEDDITASVVVPARRLVGLPGWYNFHPSLKLAHNCEFRLFQRPDDAIHPGLDRQTEEDMAGPGLFCSNFQPLAPGGRAAYRRGRGGPRRFHPTDAGARGRERGAPRRRLLDLLSRAATRRRQADQEPALPSGAAGPRSTPRPVRRGDGREAQPAAAAPRASAVPGDQRALRAPQQQARRRHPPALRLRPHPLPGAARTLHGLCVLADRNLAEHDGRRLGGRPHERPVQRARGHGRSQQRAGFHAAHRLRAASAPPPDSSGRATEWITTSVC